MDDEDDDDDDDDDDLDLDDDDDDDVKSGKHCSKVKASVNKVVASVAVRKKQNRKGLL
jgi:hypothetical protein